MFLCGVCHYDMVLKKAVAVTLKASGLLMPASKLITIVVYQSLI